VKPGTITNSAERVRLLAGYSINWKLPNYLISLFQSIEDLCVLWECKLCFHLYINKNFQKGSCLFFDWKFICVSRSSSSCYALIGAITVIVALPYPTLSGPAHYTIFQLPVLGPDICLSASFFKSWLLLALSVFTAVSSLEIHTPYGTRYGSIC
jgi:hypothetical protein